MNQRFSDQLARCECCPRKCGVNRLEGRTGFCRIGSDALISYAGLHFGEEPPISGTRGSGTLFFAGCNLRCVFCQNHQISQDFRPDQMTVLTTDGLVAEMLRLAESGAHNINLVSPSHVVFQAADAIVAARNRGLSIPIVYNSNGYDSVDALQQIRGLVDIYLPDIKYLSNDLARRYSAATDYAQTIPGVLREMLDQVGHLELDENGIARRGLLVRHLVLPGHVDNSRRCLAFLAELPRDIFVSIMSQYSPRHRASCCPDINRTLSVREYDEITDYALSLGLENAFIQELDSRDSYLPDFDLDRPFE
ncbi:MAG TPA: radical SAM protein [Sedimentisphaerales bacterium]|nr:radical SAM protein [Sedimentisphaerales bacterium]